MLSTDTAGSGEPTVANLGAVGGDTCHVDVIDRWGNMVSATPSAGWLQSSPVIPELGFPMGTRGQMFWTRQGLPNSIAPKKRPRTTAVPSLVLEERFDDAVLADLRARGHDVYKGEDWSEGRLSAARLEPDGQRLAGANPRGMQGYEVGPMMRP